MVAVAIVVSCLCIVSLIIYCAVEVLRRALRAAFCCVRVFPGARLVLRVVLGGETEILAIRTRLEHVGVVVGILRFGAEVVSALPDVVEVFRQVVLPKDVEEEEDDI